MTKKKGNQVYDNMMMSQFIKDNDVFSDCGIRRRCAPNLFARAQNQYHKGLFYNSNDRICRARRGIRYTNTIASYHESKLSFCHLQERIW